MDMQRRERIKGGIFGLIIGDALGVPYEFRAPTEIPKWEEIEFIPPLDFQSSYPSVKPGTWSDDSAQALCLLDSLLTNNAFNLEDFSNKLYLWLSEGLWAVDRQVFDCGIQTHTALSAFRSGMAVEQCGFVKPNGKGNGALMRVLPLALWSDGSNESLILDAHQQCLITHGHICNQVCCALYCLWTRYILEQNELDVAYQKAEKELMTYYRQNGMAQYQYELDLILQDGNFSGGGYVVDSLRSAKYLLFQYQDYERVVKGAVALGNDTDTTAAIAGGLAGTYYGFSAIPPRFIEKLRGKDSVERLVNRLLDR